VPKVASFVDATTPLLGGTGDLSHLAKELKCSVQRLRQARLDPEKRSYRSPPAGWQRALTKILKGRIKKYNTILDSLGTR
jgi:hypothetical protein